jgi:hypothetical protein
MVNNQWPMINDSTRKKLESWGFGHSGESRNPVFDFIHFFEILDARFRWHDELRHSLFTKGGILFTDKF